MPFFEEVDASGIIERTIKQVDILEEQEAKALLRRFRETRRELRDRLDVLPADIFSAQQLRGTLAQVDAAINQMAFNLKEDVKPGAEKMAIRGSEDLIHEIEKFEKMFLGAVVPINIDAVRIGLDTQNFLINRYQSSIDSYAESLRGQITAQLTNLSIQQQSFDQMIRKMSRFFIGEEWRLRRITRTELHNMYNLAKLNSLEAARDAVLPDLKKTMIHPMDLRTGKDSKQLARKNPIVSIDKPFIFTFRRRRKDGSVVEDRREFMAPPDRPNDRAVLVPFRSEWDKAA